MQHNNIVCMADKSSIVLILLLAVKYGHFRSEESFILTHIHTYIHSSSVVVVLVVSSSSSSSSSQQLSKCTYIHTYIHTSCCSSSSSSSNSRQFSKSTYIHIVVVVVVVVDG